MSYSPVNSMGVHCMVPTMGLVLSVVNTGAVVALLALVATYAPPANNDLRDMSDNLQTSTADGATRTTHLASLVADSSVPLDGLSIARGNVPGTRLVQRFGTNPDVDTATDPEDIWNQGGQWVAPTTARIHDIVSSDVNDDVAGTGCRTVQVWGLDSNWDEITETLDMDGTTNVPTTLAFGRLYRIRCLTFGTGRTNAGTIAAVAQTDGTTSASMRIGGATTLMAIHPVPRNTTAYMTGLYASLIRASTPAGAMAEITLWIRPDADVATSGWRIARIFGVSATGSTAVDQVMAEPLKIDEKTDIRMEVSVVTDNDSIVSGGFTLVLVDGVE